MVAIVFRKSDIQVDNDFGLVARSQAEVAAGTGGGRVLSEIPYVAVGWWVEWCLTLKMVKIQKVPRVLFEETRNVFLITPIHPISTLII